jgi:bifunctional aspartokinase / homoserine dehydrogenase 1
MKRSVVKFGGSTLKYPADTNRIIDVIRKYKSPPIIIVSAFFGVTDSLISTLKHNFTETDVERLIALLHQKSLLFLEPYITDSMNSKNVLRNVGILLDGLKKRALLLKSSCCIDCDIYDHLISYGERLSSLIICSILRYYDFKAEEAHPEQVGMVTDGNSGNSRINIEYHKNNIGSYFKKDRIYVIPGFYGISGDSKITLFGRGGSDYSAAVIAACINASSLDLWKDVGGIRSADPKFVPDTKGIDLMSYNETEEMSSFGAGIVNPMTIEPLIKFSIPLRIYNICSFNKEMKPDTIIHSNSAQNTNRIKCISFSRNFGILTLNGSCMKVNPNTLSRIIELLENNNLEIKSLISTRSMINILLEQSACHKAYQILSEKEDEFTYKINEVYDIAVIAIVGVEESENINLVGTINEALSASNIKIRYCFFGSPSVISYVIVDKQHCKNAVYAIHNRIFSGISVINKINESIPLRGLADEE